MKTIEIYNILVLSVWQDQHKNFIGKEKRMVKKKPNSEKLNWEIEMLINGQYNNQILSGQHYWRASEYYSVLFYTNLLYYTNCILELYIIPWI